LHDRLARGPHPCPGWRTQAQRARASSGLRPGRRGTSGRVLVSGLASRCSPCSPRAPLARSGRSIRLEKRGPEAPVSHPAPALAPYCPVRTSAVRWRNCGEAHCSESPLAKAGHAPFRVPGLRSPVGAACARDARFPPRHVSCSPAFRARRVRDSERGARPPELSTSTWAGPRTTFALDTCAHLLSSMRIDAAERLHSDRPGGSRPQTERHGSRKASAHHCARLVPNGTLERRSGVPVTIKGVEPVLTGLHVDRLEMSVSF
jgi:hypothetical protein